MPKYVVILQETGTIRAALVRAAEGAVEWEADPNEVHEPDEAWNVYEAHEEASDHFPDAGNMVGANP